jgi:hypothetical protein
MSVDDNDPLAPYFAKGRALQPKILAEIGRTYTDEQVCSMLRVSPEKLDTLCNRKLLFGLPVDGRRLYPAWQFERHWLFRHRIRPEISNVLRALDMDGVWSIAVFFLEYFYLLKANRMDRLLLAAQNYYEQGGR